MQIVRPAQAFFWSTYSGAEVDLFFLCKGQRFGVEFKFSEAPKVTKSMRVAVNDLNLRHLWVIHPGPHRYPVDDHISVWPLAELPALAAQFRTKSGV